MFFSKLWKKLLEKEYVWIKNNLENQYLNFTTINVKKFI